MTLIKIIDDQNITTTYPLDAYSLSQCDKKLLLKIDTPKTSFEYKISSDSREPNLEIIKDFISKQFDDALKNNSIIELTEYLVRSYIYIQDGDDRKQFTAYKL